MRLSIVAASLAFMVVALIPERSEARAGNCPHGYRWSYKYKTCKAICPPGQKPDATGRCQEVRDSCPDGFFWSRTEGRCMNRCRPGTTWSTAQSRCVGVERPAPRCGPGWAWSAYYNRCIRASRCPTGTRWNGTYCEAWRACPAGYYFSSYFNSCRPQVRSCPFGYQYRVGYGCVPRCPSGWYWTGGTCRKAATNCPNNMFYSYSLRRCVRRCGPRFFWDYRAQRCRPRYW